MTFSDILALAKQGYTPSDIKELLALSTEETAAQVPAEEVPEITQKAETQPEEQKVQEVVEKPTEPELDYKALYEESQKKLESIQKSNVQKDYSNNVKNTSDADVLLDIMKNL